MNVRALAGALLALLSSLPMAALAAADRSKEIAEIRALLDSEDSATRAQASKRLYDFSGITDRALFDLIAQRLVDGARTGDKQEMAWYAKALASSGDTRYVTTLRSLVPAGADTRTRLDEHIDTAVTTLQDFARWNPIINSESTRVEGEDWELTRARNMLRSGDVNLQRGGLRKARPYRRSHPEIYGIVEEELRKIDVAKAEAAEDIPTLNSIAWMCRGLGESGNAKYEPLLRQLHAGAKTRIVARGCKRGVQMIERGGGDDDPADEKGP